MMATRGNRESASALDSTARDWVMRLYCEDLDDAIKASFQDWVNEAEEHRTAFLRAEQLWEDIGLLDAATWDASSPGMVESGHDNAKGETTWRRPSVFLATAACLLLAVFVGVSQLSRPPAIQTYNTGVGETRQFALPDGSTLTLGAASAITVAINDVQREVTLEKGRARFDVSHDASRPFEVKLGNATVRVLGTVFSVRKGVQSSQVAVVSGHVSVRAAEMAEGAELRAGQGVSLTAVGSLEDVSDIDTDAALAWLEGRFSYNGTPLADVIQDINSHRHRKVHIAGESLGQLRITASFSVDQAGQFIDGLSLSQPLRINRQGAATVLLPAEQ